jgi:hypothetical protein
VREALATPLSAAPAALETVIGELVFAAGPGLMASAGPRYFGLVIGGSPGAPLAADLLTSGWDQCAFNEALSPAALAFEDVAGGWWEPERAGEGIRTLGPALTRRVL